MDGIMIDISDQWLAILLSGALVWIASALVWMVMPHHKKEFRGVPNEELARSALGQQNLKPGQYMIPYCEKQEDMKSEAMVKKWKDGPIVWMTVMPNGMPVMGKSMALSFIYYLVVSTVVAYILSRTLTHPGVEYLDVFRIAGVTSWMAFSFGDVMNAVWFGKPWGNTIKILIDGLVYALLVAGVFGWQWTKLAGM